MATLGRADKPIQIFDVESSDHEPSKATQTKCRNFKKKRTSSKSALSTKGKRKAKGKLKQAKNARGTIEDIRNGPAKERCPTPDQLKYYSGMELELLKDAIYLMRVYLLTRDGFPEPRKLLKCAKIFFRAACRSKLGAKWKGLSRVFLLIRIVF